MSNTPNPVNLYAEDAYRQRIQDLDKAVEKAKQKKGRVLNVVEEKNLGRSVSNQLSLKRRKLNKLQYVDEMEKKIAQLEVTIGNLRPEVENLKQSNTELGAENSILEEKLKKWTDYSNSVDAQIEERKAEISTLEEYRKMLKNGASSSGVGWQPEPDPDPEPDEDIEQYLNLDDLYPDS